MICREESLLYAKFPAFLRKVENAQIAVEAALAELERPYIAFSTGKDSTCLLHLVRSQGPNIDAVFFDADCSYPESWDLLREYERLGVPIEQWKTEPLLDVYRSCGLDSPRLGYEIMCAVIYDPATRLIRERGYDGVFLGLRAAESRGRGLMAARRGEIAARKYDGMVVVNPLLWWTDQDVWAYIHANQLPYNRAYDYAGVERVAFWACMTNDSRGRLVELKRHWPGLFNRLAAEFPEVTRYA